MQIFTDNVSKSKCHFRKILYMLMKTELFHFSKLQYQSGPTDGIVF